MAAHKMSDYGKIFINDLDDRMLFQNWAQEQGYTADKGLIDTVAGVVVAEAITKYLKAHREVLDRIDKANKAAQAENQAMAPVKKAKEEKNEGNDKQYGASKLGASTDKPNTASLETASPSSAPVSQVSETPIPPAAFGGVSKTSSKSAPKIAEDNEIDPAMQDVPFETPGTTSVTDDRTAKSQSNDQRDSILGMFNDSSSDKVADNAQRPADEENAQGRLRAIAGSDLHGYVKEALVSRGGGQVSFGQYQVPYQFGHGMAQSKTMSVTVSLVNWCQQYWRDHWPSQLTGDDMAWLGDAGRQLLVEAVLIKDVATSQADWQNYWLSRIDVENSVPKRQQQFKRANFNPVQYVVQGGVNKADAKFRFMWAMVLMDLDELKGHASVVDSSGQKVKDTSNQAVMNQLLINQRLLSANLAMLTAEKVNQGQLPTVDTKDRQKLLEQLLCGNTTRGYDAAVGKYSPQILKTAKTRLRTKHNHR